MNWSDYLKQQEVIENCRQHYYDSMVDEDYDNNDDEDDEYKDEEEDEE